ncbi:MAG TPA: hypothetical protein VFV67_11265 [Actinophytocola sp.]|uniref:hypothetical protein n=1 Tax=Actinophytocola sp. TaxID=1872138 RepID=UPI002DBBDD0D|nr:hypothetical protein [Actinophytocola sp.]HEU5471223.1 hypothetical protein [Actinophytocola sp.]
MQQGKLRRLWLAAAAALMLPMMATVGSGTAHATPEQCDRKNAVFPAWHEPAGVEVEHWGRKARVMNDSIGDETSHGAFFQGRESGDLIWVDRSINRIPASYPKYISTADVQANGGWKQCGPFGTSSGETDHVTAVDYAIRVCIRPSGRDSKCSDSWVIDER